VNVEVLGSAAGGGVPQWNCACANCGAARGGEVAVRTQDSIAASADGDSWLVCNASPDILVQLARSLHPRGPRQAPFGAIVLTNGDIDHCLGLFNLRESTPLVVYATDAVWRGLVEHNAMARTLRRFPGHTTWRPLALGVPTPIAEVPGLAVTAIAAAGKPPLHLRDYVAPSPEDNIGVVISDGHRRIGYFPCSASAQLGADDLDLLLFDGTFWSDDELIRAELGCARASDMAHVPIDGGSLHAFAHVRCKVYTHVNNTNPILRDGSPEHAAVAAAGWEVARDRARYVVEIPEPQPCVAAPDAQVRQA